MRIADPSTDRLTLVIERDEVFRILEREPLALGLFIEQLYKFKTWCDDVKRIKTKQLLEGVKKDD